MATDPMIRYGQTVAMDRANTGWWQDATGEETIGTTNRGRAQRTSKLWALRPSNAGWGGLRKHNTQIKRFTTANTCECGRHKIPTERPLPNRTKRSKINPHYKDAPDVTRHQTAPQIEPRDATQSARF